MISDDKFAISCELMEQAYNYLRDEYEQALNALEEAETENAKLRELVRDMFRDFANADYELKRNHGRTFMAVTRYEPRLQEMGIEVKP